MKIRSVRDFEYNNAKRLEPTEQNWLRLFGPATPPRCNVTMGFTTWAVVHLPSEVDSPVHITNELLVVCHHDDYFRFYDTGNQAHHQFTVVFVQCSGRFIQ